MERQEVQIVYVYMKRPLALIRAQKKYNETHKDKLKEYHRNYYLRKREDAQWMQIQREKKRSKYQSKKDAFFPEAISL